MRYKNVILFMVMENVFTRELKDYHQEKEIFMKKENILILITV